MARSDVLAKYGISQRLFYRILRKHSVAVHQHHPERPMMSKNGRLTAEQEQALADDYRNGMARSAVVEKYGVPQRTMYRILNKHEITRHKRRPPQVHNRGDKHHSWRGGRMNDDGYKLVRVWDDDPFYCMINHDGYVLEHRYTMAKYLGRPLLKSETVHHIDGDKLNNAIENLQMRIGQHGNGQAYCCLDCGSKRIAPTELAIAL